MMHELTIFISPEGKVRLEVDGVRGPSCLDVTKAIEESLGSVTERQKKASFHSIKERETVSLSREGKR